MDPLGSLSISFTLKGPVCGRKGDGRRKGKGRQGRGRGGENGKRKE